MSSPTHPIPRRDVARLLVAGALLGRSAPWLHAAPRDARPNILFIQADDLGWSDLGCYGADQYATPAIDQLAQSGLRFTQAYAGAPICTPSRACLLTGQHCARLHITGQPGYKTEDTRGRRFMHPDFETHFSADTPCVARTLHNAGYHTALFGKWGFDDAPESHGFAAMTSGPDHAVVDAAIELIRRDLARPFFAHVNYSRPHVPLQPDAGRVAEYAARPGFREGRYNPTYAAELEAMDHETARLLTALDRAGRNGNTVVIFTSDNGGFLGYDNERIANNAPLREGKASLYEGGIRVPLIVRWPGATRPASATATLVHGVDWHTTLAEMVGANAPAAQDGRSFAACLRGGREPPARPLYWHYPHYRRAIAGLSASPSSAVRDGDWKLIHFYESDAVELYNLRDDPGETRDLALAVPDRAAMLRRQLDVWRRAVGAQPPVRG